MIFVVKFLSRLLKTKRVNANFLVLKSFINFIGKLIADQLFQTFVGEMPTIKN
jgi:hypothetical protein